MITWILLFNSTVLFSENSSGQIYLLKSQLNYCITNFVLRNILIKFQESPALAGLRFANQIVIRPKDLSLKIVPNTNNTIPSYMYDGPTYPDYLSGSAFIVPKRTLHCLYKV